MPSSRKLLDDVKQAAAEAADTFKASCAQNFPLTPPGRLAAMTNRLEATLQAVRTVRPALAAFYNSLSDEQKARFTAIGPDVGADRPGRRRGRIRSGTPKPAAAKSPVSPICRSSGSRMPCGRSNSSRARSTGSTRRPDKAVDLLAAACPDFIALTPVGRLEAMEKRLEAMVQAGKTVQPAMEEFYASLSNEQKARFNTLGQQAERGQ